MVLQSTWGYLLPLLFIVLGTAYLLLGDNFWKYAEIRRWRGSNITSALRSKILTILDLPMRYRLWPGRVTRRAPGTPEHTDRRRSLRTPPRRRSAFSTASQHTQSHDDGTLQQHGQELLLSRRKRKKLVLDLDETLIHASVNCINPSFDLHIELYIDKQLTEFYVYKRPHVDVFLETLAQWYDIIVFTASLGEYANPVIDALDRGRGIIKQRFFRESCGPDFAKSLHIVHDDLRSVIIVDNSPAAYVGHEESAVPIATWYNNQDDEELLDLIPFFAALVDVQDVRNVLRFRTYC